MAFYAAALIIFSLYFLVVFVGFKFLAPYFIQRDFVLPKPLPEFIQAAVFDLESAAKDQRAYLEAAYSLVMDKNERQWKHTRFQAAFNLPRLFVKDLEELWSTKDFIYCTGINYILFVLLASSKFFKPGDVRVKNVFLNFVLHQYLEVRVGEAWVDVDPAGAGIRGRPLGKHAEWFG